MSRRILILANPIAGGGRARELAPQLLAALRQRDCAPELFFSQQGGDLAARARQSGGEHWDALVAVGGDGSVGEVLNGMPDPSRPLGVLPVGTANVLACEYRLPRRPEQVAALVANGHTQEHAIGRAGARRFLLFCGAGYDGAIVARMSATRTGTLGKHKWLAPIAHVLRQWPQFHLRAVLASGEVLDDLATVLVTRVRNYGGWLHLPRGIATTSQQLHVLCFRQRRRRQWLWLGGQGFCGGLRPSPQLTVHATTAVRIEGDAPYQLDGDRGGDTPIELSLEPVRARLLVLG